VARPPLLSSRPVLRAPGRALLAAVRRLVSYSALGVLAVVALVRRPGEGGGMVRSQIARQVVFSAWDAIPMVAFIAALLSISLVALAATLVPAFEANLVLVRVLTLVLVRELAPLMTAILVVLRSCGAIAVELGYMSWRGELEALETLGIDPAKFVLLPRFVGLTVAVVSMTFLFVVAAMGASLVTAHFFAVAPSLKLFGANVSAYLHPEDVLIAFIKSLLYGGTIAAVACYHGLSVRDDITEVPRRASRALVEALSWCTVIGVAITLITL
jgi:phospholipid/cholesterol/gamma-HCH transport system permease protein